MEFYTFTVRKAPQVRENAQACFSRVIPFSKMVQKSPRQEPEALV